MSEETYGKCSEKNLKYQSEAYNSINNSHRGQIEMPDNGMKSWGIRPQQK